MSRIFLSHSSKNNSEAIVLHDWLGREGWKDEIFLDLDPMRGIAAGERWERALNQAANRCEAVLFLISKDWIASGWCRRELSLAHRLNKRLFGLLIEDLTIEEIPKDLTNEWQLVRLASGRDHVMLRALAPITHEEVHATFSAEGLQRLKHGLEQAGLDPKYFAWPPLNDPNRPPYRGLRSFEAEDAGIFFGRDAPVIAALDRLRGLREAAPPRLLVILGASGAGKSSFMRAGLLPRLKRDDRRFLVLPIIRPERAAIFGDNGLLPALEEACKAAKLATTRADLRVAIEGGAAKLGLLLQSLAQNASLGAVDCENKLKPPTLIIPVDQGEELFLAEGQDEARAFLGLLQDLLSKDAPALITLFTIRSDAYEHLQLAAELEGISQEMLNLPPMPTGSYIEVIKGPSLRLQGTGRSLKLEDSLVDALLADIAEGGGKDALALLAFTLERLYLEYGGRGKLMLADYVALKGIKGSIEAAVEQAFKEADKDPTIPKDRNVRLALLRRGLIPWIAGIDPDTGSPRRRVARKSEIPEEARSLIDQLVEQRLLATDISQATGEQTIEPAHEALLRQWGQLQGWLAEDAGLLSLLEGIKRATRDWVANGKDEAWLTHVTGRLVAAERLRQRADLSASLDRTEWDYLKACRQREDTQIAEMKAARKRRRRLELSLVVVLLVTSCAGTIYAAWTNYDYLEVRAAMLANELWPTKLSHEAERNLAQINLQPGQIISFRECTMCPEMVVVPAGSFDMGSPPDEKGRGDNESPQHRVTIQNNYAVGKFEVTFEEWDACVKARVCANAWDQGWGRGKRPVINVSWHEAQQYVQWLAERIGKVGSYRLLSEAEWEYAARGGKPTAYYFGEDEAELGQYAWYGGNSDEKSKPVGGKLPNAFGLFDMHGNVWEWVEDCYHKNYAGAPIDGSAWTTSCEQDYRIHRSGSWYHPAQRLRAAFRGKYASDYRDDGVGLRVARTLSID